MRSAPLLLLSLAAAAACQTEAGPDVYEEVEPRLFCGTTEPTDGGKLATELATSRMPNMRSAAAGGTIDVYVHVIRSGPSVDQGNVPDAAIDHQLDVLNGAFASAGWSFRLAGVDRTTNPTWFAMTQGTAAETAAKFALRRGTARALNLYTADPGQGFLGYATLPAAATAAPYKDGVVMLHSTLPGGSTAPFDLGDQTVHQVGHWLGLYHTYQGDCANTNGDYVNDTPATSMPAFGCPVGRDTCGGGGEDAVRNYMDSSDDGCMNTFTAGQRERIDAQFNAYRRF